MRTPGYALIGVTGGATIAKGIDAFVDVRNITGKKAIEFRLAYVQRFDEMEAKLAARKERQIREENARQLILRSEDEPLIRESIPVGPACRHLWFLGVHLSLTPGQMKGKLKRGELEGTRDDRGHWRIYLDQLTKLATGN